MKYRSSASFNTENYDKVIPNYPTIVEFSVFPNVPTRRTHFLSVDDTKSSAIAVNYVTQRLHHHSIWIFPRLGWPQCDLKAQAKAGGSSDCKSHSRSTSPCPQTTLAGSYTKVRLLTYQHPNLTTCMSVQSLAKLYGV